MAGEATPSSEPGQPSIERPGLYLHVPFCDSVCPYCDFAVLIAGPQRRAAFVTALETEIGIVAGLRGETLRQADTIYLGGGTPSSLDPADLDRILTEVRRHLDPATQPWITMEVNPEHVNAAAARAWRSLGVRTVSLGMQSVDDSLLRALGRRHDAATGRAAYDHLREAGFETVSLDLIFGMNGHEPRQWRRQLESVASLAPDHVSCYQLTIHPGTVLGKAAARGEVHQLDEDRQAELFLLTHEVLDANGLQAYEVSNFAAASGHRSIHNLKYWCHTPYLGLGPAAHSFAASQRWWNRRKLRLWQAALDQGRAPVEGSEILTPVDLATEAVMLGLRTTDGIDPERVRQLTGVDLAATSTELVDRLVRAGLLRIEGGCWRPTARGLAVADGLAALFEVVDPG